MILAALAAAPAAARAELPRDRGLDYVIVEPEAGGARRDAFGPDTLYLNRCVGGCRIIACGNNAHTNQSSIASVDTTLTEFMYSDLIWLAANICTLRIRDTEAGGREVVHTIWAHDPCDQLDDDLRPYIEHVVSLTPVDPSDPGVDPEAPGLDVIPTLPRCP